MPMYIHTWHTHRHVQILKNACTYKIHTQAYTKQLVSLKCQSYQKEGFFCCFVFKTCLSKMPMEVPCFRLRICVAGTAVVNHLQVPD